MKARISSTSEIVHLKSLDDRVRVWEGETEDGIRFVAYISMFHVMRPEDDIAFHDDLDQSPPPDSVTRRAVALRHDVMRKCRGVERQPSPEDYPPGWVTGRTP